MELIHGVLLLGAYGLVATGIAYGLIRFFERLVKGE